jgi:hypothetical protein
MNAEFTAIVQTLVAEQGKDALVNPAKCKAFLPDYTKSEFTKERRLLLKVVEAGAVKEIAAAADPDICKKQQVRHLTEELFMAEDAAAEVVDMLVFVLRGDTPAAEDRSQDQSTPDAKPKPVKKPRRKKTETSPVATTVVSQTGTGTIHEETTLGGKIFKTVLCGFGPILFFIIGCFDPDPFLLGIAILLMIFMIFMIRMIWKKPKK